MSISSQSQEAITAIDAELEAILQKRRDVTNSNKEEVTEQEELQAGTQSVEGDETESEAETDTEIAPDDDEAKDNTVSRKRKGGDDSSEPLAKSHTLVCFLCLPSKNMHLLSFQNLLKRPHLQRTKSLEAISHNPPTKVCVGAHTFTHSPSIANITTSWFAHSFFTCY